MSDIELTVYIDGTPTNIDRDLLPKDINGRPYEYIINERDEFGLYKRDEKYYNKQSIEHQKQEIEKWYQKQIDELNKDYDDLEIELFSTLETEARLYKSCGKHTNKIGHSIVYTPCIDYLLQHDNRYKNSKKDDLITTIINKADTRKINIVKLVVEKKNRINNLINIS